MIRPEIAELAATHGLQIDPSAITVVEAGLDYRAAFAMDDEGTDWVLRIPRRADVSDKIPDEARILDFVRPRLSAAVPEWKIHTRDLIAYPLLPGTPGLTLNDAGEPEFHFDQENRHYARQLGRLIAELHGMSPDEAKAAGIPTQSPEDVRVEWRARLERVSAEFSLNDALSHTWHTWIQDDELWPEYTAFTHGELYPAHLLLNDNCDILSVLDWTTAKVGDPAVDFMYQRMMSTPEAFAETLGAYAEITGQRPRRFGRALRRPHCRRPPHLRRLRTDNWRPNRRGRCDKAIEPLIRPRGVTPDFRGSTGRSDSISGEEYGSNRPESARGGLDVPPRCARSWSAEEPPPQFDQRLPSRR